MTNVGRRRRAFLFVVALAGSLPAACDNTSKECTAIACGSYASALIPLSSDDSLFTNTMVRACRNDVCATTPLPPPPDVGPSIPVAFPSVEDVHGWLSTKPDGSRTLEVDWSLRDANPRDGDHYVVTLVHEGTMLSVLDQTAKYTTLVTEGAPSCSSCYEATLMP
jgi:hypothetical protein